MRFLALPTGTLALLVASALPAQSFTSGAVRAGAAHLRDTLVIDELARQAYAGAPVPLSATVRRAGHTASASALPVVWESRSPTTAWVTDDGHLVPLAAGRVTLVAHLDGLRAERTVTVHPTPAGTVAFTATPDAATLVGDTLRLEAQVRGRAGVIADAPITFALDARGRATQGAVVTAAGAFVASEPGLYTVIAQFGRGAATHSVLVRPRPIVLAPVRRPETESEAPAFRGRALEAVVVRAAATRRMRIAGSDFHSYVGTMLRLAADVWAEGASEPDSTAFVRWSSSDERVARVDHEGRVEFRAPGRVTLTARHGGAVAERTFHVTPHLAAELVLRAPAGSVRVDEPLRLRTDVWMRGGTPVRDARVHYAVVAHTPGAAAASVSEDRVFVAREPGVYTIIAEANGLADRLTVIVQPALTAPTASDEQ